MAGFIQGGIYTSLNSKAGLGGWKVNPVYYHPISILYLSRVAVTGSTVVNGH